MRLSQILYRRGRKYELRADDVFSLRLKLCRAGPTARRWELPSDARDHVAWDVQPGRMYRSERELRESFRLVRKQLLRKGFTTQAPKEYHVTR